MHDVHDAARHGPLPPAVELVGVRLPRRCAPVLWAQCGDARFETAKVEARARRAARSSCTPTAATCTRRSSSTRSAGGASSRARTTSRPTRRSAAASRSTRTRRRRRRALDVWVERVLVRRGYGWRVPAGGEARVGVGSYDPRDHVKEPTSDARRALERRRRPLPGQLVPAPAARRRRGRRVLRRRQRRPLLPALGRGHPHRVLLRHRRGPRAARGRSPASAGRASDALRALRAPSTSGHRARVPPARLRLQRARSRRCRRGLLTLALRAARAGQRPCRPRVRLVPGPGAPGLRRAAGCARLLT